MTPSLILTNSNNNSRNINTLENNKNSNNHSNSNNSNGNTSNEGRLQSTGILPPRRTLVASWGAVAYSVLISSDERWLPGSPLRQLW